MTYSLFQSNDIGISCTMGCRKKTSRTVKLPDQSSVKITLSNSQWQNLLDYVMKDRFSYQEIIYMMYDSTLQWCERDSDDFAKQFHEIFALYIETAINTFYEENYRTANRNGQLWSSEQHV